ncbi:protein NAR1-like [Populus alba x Populus x berolinensis]|nr:protein NAR1-like [Populus alba x Populus x berolinensis]
MSEKFSPTLRIGDLSDFIAPSQACVVSLKGLKTTTPNTRKRDKPEVAIANREQDDPVKISLKDCLACSGCITSAETVMLEKQSLDEFLSSIDKGKAIIVSLSPQSRASLAVYFGISPLQVFKKLTTFFKSLGVKAVFDTSCSRDLTLVETCNEFLCRYKQSQLNIDEKPNPSLPMLSSACPGWICYAEKQLGSYILPYVSSVKSPQQTIGATIKHHICQKMGLRPDEVYHVTVMPCYDKKLEAARGDFVFEVEQEDANKNSLRITEVDSVLTTGEVLDLIKLKAVDIETLDGSPLDKMLTNVSEEGYLYGVPGSSGGYAETVLRYAARMVFGREIEGPLAFRSLRNKDFCEVTLEVSDAFSYLVDGKVVLKFALCYGFQNLQNIVRKVKMGRCDYHFVEIMACPSGCLNGGGQIKPKPQQSPRELLHSLETIYMENILVKDPFENPLVKSLYDEWLDQPGSEKAKRHMHTEYHPVTNGQPLALTFSNSCSVSHLTSKINHQQQVFSLLEKRNPCISHRETKTMTTSKRLSEKKVAKFQKNITKRGSVPETSTKKGYDYPVGPILLGFFVFVVIGSSLFQIIRTASSGGMA